MNLTKKKGKQENKSWEKNEIKQIENNRIRETNNQNKLRKSK